MQLFEFLGTFVWEKDLLGVNPVLEWIFVAFFGHTYSFSNVDDLMVMIAMFQLRG